MEDKYWIVTVGGNNGPFLSQPRYLSARTFSHKGPHPIDVLKGADWDVALLFYAEITKEQYNSLREWEETHPVS